MAINIEVFKAEVARRNGIMKSSKFKLSFVAPPTILPDSRHLEYWCEAATIPGYQLMMGDVRRWTYGPHEKRPYGPNTVALQTVFLSDADGSNLRFFQEWMNFIIPHSVPNSMNTPSGGMYPYEVQYKYNRNGPIYVTDIHVSQYRDDGTKMLEYVIKEAFPSQIIDIPVGWEAANQHMKFQVVFDYLDWYLLSRTETKNE